MEAFDEKRLVSFEFEIENPSFVYIDRKSKYVCKEAEYLKHKIRDKYSKIITPYYYDTILHMSDDQQQTLYLRKILYKYKNYIEKTPASKKNAPPVTGCLNLKKKTR